jgi:tetratricopeptide (TPR) repeat protein
MMGNVHVCLGDAARARQEYERARTLDGQGSVASAQGLNRYALQLWQSGRVTQSLTLFEIAAGLFPHEAVLYESLAEIYLERSRMLFEKALEVDPTTAHARRMLEKLGR